MTPGFANPRSWFLALLTGVLMAGYFNLPIYRAWVPRVVAYYSRIPVQLRNMNMHARMAGRHVNDFLVLDQVGQQMEEGDVFLLPPTEYVRRNFDANYWHWAEPRFFYYYLGRLPTVTLESQKLDSATCTVRADSTRRLYFTRFKDTEQRDLAIRAFRENSE